MEKQNNKETSPPIYRQVIRYLDQADNQEPSHDVRQRVLSQFKSEGGDSNRWSVRDYRIMSDAITQMEDEVELRTDSKNRQQARLTLSKVRRMLEIHTGNEP